MGKKKKHGGSLWDMIPPWDQNFMISPDPHNSHRMMASMHPSMHPSMFSSRTDFEMAMRSMQKHGREHPIESFQNTVMAIAQECLVPEGVEIDVEINHHEIIVRVPSVMAGDADENFDVFRDRVLEAIAERARPKKQPDGESAFGAYMRRTLIGQWLPRGNVAITLEDQPNY